MLATTLSTANAFVGSNVWKAVAAAAALIVMTSNSTSTSALFVAYRTHWGLTPADIGLAFSAYVGTLIPVLVIFGGSAERFGRRPIVLAGMLFMALGTLTLVFAQGLPLLIAARLLQGAGAALAIGPTSATFTEAYQGKIAAGQALAVVQALALTGGPVVTAIAYDLGAGPNLSYLPMLFFALAILGLTPFFATKRNALRSPQPTEETLPASAVWRGLRFAMPIIFVSWAGNSLYLSLVPAYIAASLHASDPLIGAGAFFATQLAAVLASIYFGNVSPERAGVVGVFVVVFGLALLVAGTDTNSWAVIAVATLLVGAGSGVASGAAYATADRVGRGQRARIFARLLVAAYLGYSVPSLLIGFITTRSSFTIGFTTAIAALAVIALSTPLLKGWSLNYANDHCRRKQSPRSESI
jgi:MFS family permease